MYSNELEKKSIPRDQLKKYYANDETKTNMKTEHTSVEFDTVEENVKTSRPTTTAKNNTNTTVNTGEYDNELDMIDNMIGNTQAISDFDRTVGDTVFTSDEEDSFLPDPNAMTSTPITHKDIGSSYITMKEGQMEEVTMKEEQKEDVTITKYVQGKQFDFNPLSLRSREEIGPRLITEFNHIPFRNIGQSLHGPSNTLHQIKGDGNCYFRAISFYISGKEDFHENVRHDLRLYQFFPW